MKSSFMIIVIFLFSPRAGAQEFVEMPDRDLQLERDLLSVVPDSVQRPPTRRLLPENISIVEEGLWGENGFLRSA
ncbi:MAG TPA: hypothetical protein VMM57_00845, partial [Bacteroidota bacterium]|nr:hypothetical protein [Bacteroidota bacterium]